jgi:hypothetical protein
MKKIKFKVANSQMAACFAVASFGYDVKNICFGFTSKEEVWISYFCTAEVDKTVRQKMLELFCALPDSKK